jgi:NDP-sugar pyrophosphorylase family protein
MDPMTLPLAYSRSAALELMNERDINQLPIVDQERRVRGLLLRRDLVHAKDSLYSAVVMAGGFGKRLMPLTETVPKPMLPIGNRPMLEHTIERLRQCGIVKVHLTTHYRPDQIAKHFGKGESFGVELSYLQERRPLGTAGGLKLLEDFKNTTLVINGDVLTGVRFEHMYAFHREHKADLTVGVAKYELNIPFGLVACDDVKVCRLREKPSMSFFVNAGIYLVEPLVRDVIPEDKAFDMTELIEGLINSGRTVVSYPIVEYWLDIGRHEDYQRAQTDLESGKIRSPILGTGQ